MPVNALAPKKLLMLLTSFLGMITMASALTISPARIELSGDPGSTISDTFILINEQESEQTFYTSSENFQAQGESGTPNFVHSNEGLATWVTVQSQVTLKKGEKVEIPFTITIPKDADAGGHFAAIFLSTAPPTTGQGQVALGAKVGTLLLLHVNGDIKEGGGLLSFGIKNSNWFLFGKPVDFSYRFNNSGNDRVNPAGEIIIRNMFGFRTAVLNANPTNGNILPSSTRRFDVRWGEEEAIDPAAAFSDKVAYEWRNFAFGFYHARMDLSFGTNRTATDAVTFFVFPWHLMVIVIAAAFILFFILRALIGRYNRWIIAQAKAAK